MCITVYRLSFLPSPSAAGGLAAPEMGVRATRLISKARCHSGPVERTRHAGAGRGNAGQEDAPTACHQAGQAVTSSASAA